MSCFSLLGSFRIKPRLSCILVGDLHTVGVIGLSLPKAQHMLLPITLIGISSADSTGQMYIIHNHFNANMQGWERKYVTKEESAISILFLIFFYHSISSFNTPASLHRCAIIVFFLGRFCLFFVGGLNIVGWKCLDVKYQCCLLLKGVLSIVILSIHRIKLSFSLSASSVLEALF